MLLNGKVWKYERDIAATDVISSKYDKQGMSRQWSECVKHLLEEVDAGFAASVQRGDIVVTEGSLGAGHAHYYTTAIMSCKTAALGGLFPSGANGLFQRAAVDHGLPVWSIQGLARIVSTGDQLELDLRNGVAQNLTSGEVMRFPSVPPLILEILNAGGSRDWALHRVGAFHAVGLV